MKWRLVLWSLAWSHTSLNATQWIQGKVTNLKSMVSVYYTILLEHVIKMGAPCFDTDFVSQMKLTTFPLIYCFGWTQLSRISQIWWSLNEEKLDWVGFADSCERVFRNQIIVLHDGRPNICDACHCVIKLSSVLSTHFLQVRTIFIPFVLMMQSDAYIA